ncbi:MAG: hypothetical protein QM770_20945 [Tepidisphaeraceae bacterium]
MRFNTTRMSAAVLLSLTLLSGCASDGNKYPEEAYLVAPETGPRTIAIAPVINLSGQKQPDPLVEADIVFQQMQEVKGVTVVPVNRTVETFVALKMRQVESAEQAFIVCDALGVDALLVPTITGYDPYSPPKMIASLQLFVRRSYSRPKGVDVHELTRRATPGEMESLPRNADFIQAAGAYDAANGSVRAQLAQYTRGRVDPLGPMGEREYLMHMDRYAQFVWHELIGDLLRQMPAR